jgi:hypothetical protein
LIKVEKTGYMPSKMFGMNDVLEMRVFSMARKPILYYFECLQTMESEEELEVRGLLARDTLKPPAV